MNAVITRATPSATPLGAPAPRRARPVRKRALWRDPSGKVWWLKIVVLLLLLAPMAAIVVGALTDSLGPRPVTEAIHRTGDWTIRTLLVTLAVSPARVIFGWARVAYLRRVLGVAAACYAVTHLALYVVDEKFAWLTVAREIVLRVYLTIGFVVVFGLVALAITSVDSAVRRMGRSWNTLHGTIYVLVPLAILHDFMQSKADVTDAAFLGGLFAYLMLFRGIPRDLRGRLWVLPPLAVTAGVATALIEGAWYAIMTHVPAERVLAANLDPDVAPRPSQAVIVIGLLVFAAAAIRRIASRPRRAQPKGALAA